MRTDDGRVAGTVLVLGVCAAGLVLAVLAGVLAVAVVANRRAEAAADLAALAAVTEPGLPPDCARAAAVATANGARTSACFGGGDGSVVVDVEIVTGPVPGWAALVARGGARAGLPLSGARSAGEQGVHERRGARLVERIVAVAAFGRLDARGAAGVAGAVAQNAPRGPEPRRGGPVPALGESRAARVPIVHEHRRHPGVGVQRGRQAADVPPIARGHER